MTMGVFPISWAAPAGLDHVFRRQFLELLLLWVHLVILVFRLQLLLLPEVPGVFQVLHSILEAVAEANGPGGSGLI